jgi:putative cell wall binding repeat protein/PKD domain-containing protein
MRARSLAIAAVTSLASVGVLLPGIANADVSTLLVDNTNASCSDAVGSGTSAVPYCHIGNAVAVAQPGQTVVVNDGTYAEGVAFPNSGTPGMPITLRAAHQGRAVVRYSEPSVRIEGVHDIVVDGIDVAQADSEDQGVVVTDSSGVTLSHIDSQDLTISGAGATGDVVVASRVFSAAFAKGAHGNVLTTSIVGHVAATDAPGNTVVSDTVYGDDGTAAIDISGASTGTTIANDVVLGQWGSSGTALSVSSGSTAQTAVHHNLISPAQYPAPYNWAGKAYPNPAAFQAGTGQGAAEIFANPQLDPNTYMPRRISPAIDSADSGVPGEQATDVNGAPRVDDPAVGNSGAGLPGFDDRGAVEFQGLPVAAVTLGVARHGNTATSTTVQADASGSDWGFTPIASYTFTFSDGTVVTQPGPVLTRTFPRPTDGSAPYEGMHVTVTDQDGLSAPSGGWVYEVMPQGCGPDPVVASVPSVLPLTVTIDGSGTTAGTSSKCGFNKPDWYHFDFGDGTPEVAQQGNPVIRHTFPGPGTYTVTLTAGAGVNPSGDGDGTSVSTKVTVGDAAGVTRIAGADRFATAVATSQAQWAQGSAQAVVLARGDAFPDALAGVPLAAHVHGPLLLTDPSALTSATENEIDRVLGTGSGKTVYILGGTSAVSPAVANALTHRGFHVVRYGGTDRYDTAVQIADRGLGHPVKVVVATGRDFADALSAGPLATLEGGAVLLSDDTHLDPTTHAYLRTATQLTSVGHQADQALVSAWVQNHDIPAQESLEGADRYATSAQVAQRVIDLAGHTVRFGIATGADYPDALSGGAFMAVLGQPLILTDPAGVPPGLASLLTGDAHLLQGVTLFGGTKAIPAAVERSISDLVSERAH